MKKGFTLSELMVALAVLGVLCAVVLSMIMNNNPNQNKMMAKKAYYTTLDVVSDLINDDAVYPTIGSDGTVYVGFDNTEGVHMFGNTYSGESKFAELFASKLNLDGEVVDSCPDFEPSALVSSKNCRSFTTHDGMVWDITESISNRSMSGGIVKKIRTRSILIDTNGDAAPNCIQGSVACANRTNNFDQLSLIVADDGEVVISGAQSWVSEAIEVGSSLTGD